MWCCLWRALAGRLKVVVPNAQLRETALERKKALLQKNIRPYLEVMAGRTASVKLCPSCGKRSVVWRKQGKSCLPCVGSEPHLLCPKVDLATDPWDAKQGEEDDVDAEQDPVGDTQKQCRCCRTRYAKGAKHECPHTNVTGKCTSCNRKKLRRQFEFLVRKLTALREDRDFRDSGAADALKEAQQWRRKQKRSDAGGTWTFKFGEAREQIVRMMAPYNKLVMTLANEVRR